MRMSIFCKNACYVSLNMLADVLKPLIDILCRLEHDVRYEPRLYNGVLSFRVLDCKGDNITIVIIQLCNKTIIIYDNFLG